MCIRLYSVVSFIIIMSAPPAKMSKQNDSKPKPKNQQNQPQPQQHQDKQQESHQGNNTPQQPKRLQPADGQKLSKNQKKKLKKQQAAAAPQAPAKPGVLANNAQDKQGQKQPEKKTNSKKRPLEERKEHTLCIPLAKRRHQQETTTARITNRNQQNEYSEQKQHSQATTTSTPPHYHTSSLFLDHFTAGDHPLGLVITGLYLGPRNIVRVAATCKSVYLPIMQHADAFHTYPGTVFALHPPVPSTCHNCRSVIGGILLCSQP